MWLLFFSGDNGAPGIINGLYPSAGERDRPVPGIPITGEADQAPKIDDEISRRLIQISEGRVSGFHPTGGRVRYIEHVTGHVFEADPDGQNETRISNTTIPGIFEARRRRFEISK